ncbi:thiocyanate hydrolase [Mycolicibacter sinensis]|uniref:Thiocyanate hydrolase n=2 Tax=Mycolicibacter TaxID=1073531 RepID=A0A1A2Y317_MYCSD|nr:thiocyanate hydrolase [Mycolicibacter sinensis]OBI31798.1 thiocyanate hydrolase [Mycolicibacter sinensis]
MDEQIAVLAEIAASNQSWPVMAAKYGVENPLPPWKTSLDGLCDALDAASCQSGGRDFSFQARRDEEDVLSATRYRSVPYPENQLLALAHSLVARGVIDETELRQRLAVVRARLEAQ